MIRDPLRDIYFPIYAGDYAPAECAGRDKYIIDGKEYEECALCKASCPSRDEFKEPDSGLPLKCDMCEEKYDQEFHTKYHYPEDDLTLCEDCMEEFFVRCESCGKIIDRDQNLEACPDCGEQLIM